MNNVDHTVIFAQIDVLGIPWLQTRGANLSPGLFGKRIYAISYCAIGCEIFSLLELRRPIR